MKAISSKAHILDKGIQLFHEKGYHGTGIQDIATAAGILKGSFYNYFKSKEHFCQEALIRYSKAAIEKSEEALAEDDQNPLNSLQELYLNRIKRIQEDALSIRGCLVGNIGQELGFTNETISSTVDQCMGMDIEVHRRCLKKAQELGVLSDDWDINELAEFILNSWQGALMRVKSTNNIHPLLTFIDHIFNNLIHK